MSGKNHNFRHFTGKKGSTQKKQSGPSHKKERKRRPRHINKYQKFSLQPAESPAHQMLTFKGVPGEVIPQGSRVYRDGMHYEVAETITLSTDGKAFVFCRRLNS